MDKPKQPGPDKHAVTVTRTALKGGGAVYHVTVDAESETVIQAGCDLEGMAAGAWLVSSIHIRLMAASEALINMAEARKNAPPETIN